MAPAFTTCLFFSCFFLERWSLVSLQGLYPKPSLQITSGSVTVRGGNLTLSCTAEPTFRDMTFVLYGGVDSATTQDPSGTEAVFHFTDVNTGHGGRYYCRYYSKGSPRIESASSDAVEVTLRDLSKPSISYEPVRSVEGDYRISCSAPQNMSVKRFFLYKNGEQARLTDRSPSHGSQRVTFHISGMNDRDGAGYRCSYQIKESRESVESPLSDPIQIGKDNQQEMSTASTPRNDKQMPSVEPTQSSMERTIIIAVVCAVLLVVILVAVFILYIKCKPKKAKGDIQKRNLPLNEEKKAESLEPMYAIITKVNTSNNTIAPEAKKQEEGGHDEGLTYAVIDRDALKTKTKESSAPPSQEPQPTLYASVNIH